MSQDVLPVLLPTLPGHVLGIVGDDPPTVQCTRCLQTCSDPSWLAAVRWALFPHHDQQYDSAGNWVAGERLCADCRKACGCESCRRTGR